MISKTKVLIGILALGVVLIGGCWIWSGCETKEVNRNISEVEHPYFCDGERKFAVGFIEPIEEGHLGSPIPRMQDDDIYHFIITSDVSGTFAKMMPGKGYIEPADFKGKPFFFTGYIKGYDILHLMEENPDIEWLRHRASAFISCFEIEQMIPVEDDDSALSLDAPETLSDEFVISVTVKNILPVELVDTTLSVAITYGPFRIVATEPSDLETTSSSYYSRIIKGKYNAGEEKNYKFKIQSRGFGDINKPDFGILVSFAGYGIEGDKDKVLLEEKEIKPLYSREVQKYKLLWIKD